VPFIAVSPFSKPGYVSHDVSDHTSVLALIEKRFMVAFTPLPSDDDDHPHLTRRDQFADTLEDMFDFENSPSLNTPSAWPPHQPTIAGRSPGRARRPRRGPLRPLAGEPAQFEHAPSVLSVIRRRPINAHG
jgi:phospholipase C